MTCCARVACKWHIWNICVVVGLLVGVGFRKLELVGKIVEGNNVVKLGGGPTVVGKVWKELWPKFAVFSKFGLAIITLSWGACSGISWFLHGWNCFCSMLFCLSSRLLNKLFSLVNSISFCSIIWKWSFFLNLKLKYKNK